MKGDILPDESYITRLCSLTQLDSNGYPQSTAFLPKPTEAYVSVNWLEYLNQNSRRDAINEVLRTLRTKRHVGSQAKLALLNVGRSRAMVLTNTTPPLQIEYRHEPEVQPPDPSHSGIYNIPHDDRSVAELIALTIEALYPTR